MCVVCVPQVCCHSCCYLVSSVSPVHSRVLLCMHDSLLSEFKVLHCIFMNHYWCDTLGVVYRGLSGWLREQIRVRLLNSSSRQNYSAIKTIKCFVCSSSYVSSCQLFKCPQPFSVHTQKVKAFREIRPDCFSGEACSMDL